MVIIGYKFLQYVFFRIFIIATEYAFNIFGIQLYPYFFWHMSKHNQIHTYDLWKVCYDTKLLLVSCSKLT
jgi:hypothetical protein